MSRMNKRHLHHLWTKLRPISYWYFLVACVISVILGVVGLRQNNLHMIQLRDAVLQSDKNNGDTETALRKLREYVYAHMNTNLASGPNAIRPPIQLKYRYERLVKAEKARVDALNTKVYNDAQAECARLYPTYVFVGGRIPCIQDYLSQHGAAQVQPIPEDLYKFDFISPQWSPDLAGWSLVAAAIFGILFIIRFLLGLLIKSELTRHA